MTYRLYFGNRTVVAPASSGQMQAGVRSRKRRSYVRLDGDLIEVSGHEEAERLLRELKQEEKAQEKDRKKLLLVVKKYQVDISGPGRKPEAPEVIEQRMDARADRIAELYALILKNLEEQDEDDEEVWLLS